MKLENQFGEQMEVDMNTDFKLITKEEVDRMTTEEKLEVREAIQRLSKKLDEIKNKYDVEWTHE